ncbi:MAG: TRAP transporter fused permease subunit [Aquisalimonadaceae bacterium]
MTGRTEVASKRVVVAVLAIVLVGGTITWVLDLPRSLGFSPYTEQILTFALALSLAIAFLEFDWRGRPSRHWVWYDVLLALSGLSFAGYLTVRYPELVHELVFRPLDGVIVATVLVFLTVEGVRRTSGLALALVILAFIAFAMLGHHLPEGYGTPDLSFSRLMVYLGGDNNALLGLPLQVGVIVIIPFILLGKLLSRLGGSDFFTELAMALMGRFRGGSGKIAVVGSTLFGAVSGSAVANVAGTGVVTIPLMKRSGFPPHLAGGVEAVASTGSQLMPPVIGAAAFLMAEFLQVPYGEVMLAALVPILLYYVALFIQVDLLSAKMGLKAIPRAEIPPLLRTLKSGWYFPLPFVVFIGGLFAYNLQPELAALWAIAVLIVGVLLFGYKGRRPSLRGFMESLIDTGRSGIEIILITAGAGLVIGVLNVTGLAFDLSLRILALSGENLAVLLVMAAVTSVVLGMGMPTVGVYVLLATLIAPAIVEAGVAPMAAHLFVLYFGMLSMVTPPVALAAFAAANLAGADPWRTAMTAIRLGWTAYLVPFLFVMSPALLLIGDSTRIVLAVVTALAGVWMVSVAITGYLTGAVPWLLRLVLAMSGVMALIPADAFDQALALEIVGLVLGVLAASYAVHRGRAASSIKV